MARMIDQKYDNDSNLIEITVEDDGEYIHLERVRHGYWILKRRQYEMDECDCSECGQFIATAIGQRMSYCPNCGAKMKGENRLSD